MMVNFAWLCYNLYVEVGGNVMIIIMDVKIATSHFGVLIIRVLRENIGLIDSKTSETN